MEWYKLKVTNKKMRNRKDYHFLIFGKKRENLIYLSSFLMICFKTLNQLQDIAFFKNFCLLFFLLKRVLG